MRKSVITNCYLSSRGDECLFEYTSEDDGRCIVNLNGYFICPLENLEDIVNDPYRRQDLLHTAHRLFLQRIDRGV